MCCSRRQVVAAKSVSLVLENILRGLGVMSVRHTDRALVVAPFQ